jgi:transposase InsO family protein
MLIEEKSGAKFRLIQEMTRRDDNMLNISLLCKIAGVSRSGYYNWLKSESVRVNRDEGDKRDFEMILSAYKHRGYDKGARGIYMRLLHQNVIMNVKKIRRLMKKFRLTCPIRRANPYKKMAKALEESNVAPNLLKREFKLHGARKVLLTDITYLKRADGEFSYLCTILDAFTKQILSHALSYTLEEDFVLTAVRRLLEKHRIEFSAQTLIHSDQGGHYKAIEFIKLVNDAELRRSMSRKGNCWDNAPQESFFGHMKDEIDIATCLTHDNVVSVVDDWIDYYNNDRYQWELARLSPNEYYQYITTGEYPLPVAPPKGCEG